MNRVKIGERLSQIREQLGISRADVAKAVKIGTTTLQQWEVGNREASIEALERLAHLYRVSPQYLIFGIDNNNESNEEILDNKDLHVTDEYVYVPAYNIVASAGLGEKCNPLINTKKKLAFRRDWLENKELDPSQMSCLHVKGDSMEPTIPNDATILVDTSYNDVMDGGIFVLKIDERIFVKRTQWKPNGDLKIISDNTIYGEHTIAEQDLIDGKVEVYGRVVHISYDLPH